jgi:transketolase
MEALSRIVRGLAFAGVEAAQSDHPGGSSSKTEQVFALLAGGVLAFDPQAPKHRGRDRVVWSAGRCAPLFHAIAALIYETLRRKGAPLSPPNCSRNSACETRSRQRGFWMRRRGRTW